MPRWRIPGLIALLLLMIGGLPSAFAAETWYDLASACPFRLMAEGMDQVGDLHFRDLLEDFSSIRVQIFTQGFPIGSGDLRAGIVNFPSKRKLVISPIAVQQVSPAVRNAWLLHEAVEAVGYNDENYQLSVGLWWLANLPARDRQAFLHSKLMRNFRGLTRSDVDRIYQVAAGGITSTGGGGDPYSIQAKMQMMEAAKSARSKYLAAHPGKSMSLQQLYQKILTVPVETNYDVTHPTMTPTLTLNAENKLAIHYPVLAGLAPQMADSTVQRSIGMILEGDL